MENENVSYFDKVKITSKGLALLHKLIVLGKPLQITRAVIGDGIPEQDPVTLTELVHEIPSRQTGQSGTSAIVDLQMYLPEDEQTILTRVRVQNGDTSFIWRELAFIASDPDEGDILFAYTVDRTEHAMPFAAYDGVPITGTVDVAFYVSNSANFEANITLPAEVSLEEFKKCEDKVKTLTQTIEKQKNSIEILTRDVGFLKLSLKIAQETDVKVWVSDFEGATGIFQANDWDVVLDRAAFRADFTVDRTVDIEINDEWVTSVNKGQYEGILLFATRKGEPASISNSSGHIIPIYLTINPYTFETDFVGDVEFGSNSEVFFDNKLIHVKIGEVMYDVEGGKITYRNFEFVQEAVSGIVTITADI